MTRWSSLLHRVLSYLHFWTSLALIVSALILGVTFVILARGLGISSFGELLLLQAATQLATEFVSLGAGDAFVRRVARDPGEHQPALGHALVMTLFTTPFVSIAILLFLKGFDGFHIGLAVLVFFVVGELIGNRLAALAEHVCIAHLNTRNANLARVTVSVAKCVAAIAYFLLIGGHDVNVWLPVQSASTLASGLIVLFVFPIMGWGIPKVSFSRDDFRFGFVSMLMHLTSTLQVSADRLILGGMLGAADVAVYSAATRAVQFSGLPVQGVMRNLFSGFFLVGAHGASGSQQYAYDHLLRVSVVGAIGAVLVLAFSSFLPIVLGPGYSSSVAIVRLLAFLPMLQGIQYLFADALTGSDNQGTRVAISLGISLVYIALISAFTAWLGLIGLVLSLYLFQLISIAIFTGVLRRIVSEDRRSARSAG